jgi:phosphoglycerate kinase
MQEFDLTNKVFTDERVILRVDFNVPLKNGRIIDDTRIKAALPTIKTIHEKGGRLIILSHLGRPLKKLLPNGEVDKDQFSLKPIAQRLSELTELPVRFFDDCLGKEVKESVRSMRPGEIFLLENTRFYQGEEKGEPAMAEQLADLGTMFIHDAFGTAHRAHASTATIATFFPPEKRGFGLLMHSELENAAKVLNNPQRPLVAIVGGAKVSDKLLLLESLLDKVDILIVGGGMGYTFEKAKGGQIGNSLVEVDRLDLVLNLLAKGKEKGVEILLPEDSIIADKFAADAKIQVSESGRIPDGWMGLDIGPKARLKFGQAIHSAATILWNGPMGVFEMEPFSGGTNAVAEAVIEATKDGAFSLVGGGDSVTALNQMGLADHVSFVSTGGGAMLELIEGKTLPGVRAISG